MPEERKKESDNHKQHETLLIKKAMVRIEQQEQSEKRKDMANSIKQVAHEAATQVRNRSQDEARKQDDNDAIDRTSVPSKTSEPNEIFSDRHERDSIGAISA